MFSTTAAATTTSTTPIISSRSKNDSTILPPYNRCYFAQYISQPNVHFFIERETKPQFLIVWFLTIKNRFPVLSTALQRYPLHDAIFRRVHFNRKKIPANARRFSKHRCRAADMDLADFLFMFYASSMTVPSEGPHQSLLIMNRAFEGYAPVLPRLQRYSSNEGDRAPAYGIPDCDKRYYFVCPARPLNELEQKLNRISESKKALFYREQRKPYIFTDLPMQKCESPVRGAIRRQMRGGANELYEMGIEVCVVYIDSDRNEPDWNDPEKNFTFTSILHFSFDAKINTTTYVNYTINADVMLTASSKTDDIAFEKNLEFLKTDVDLRYSDFRSRILPRMQSEKSNNPLAHALGIQKVQMVLRDDFFSDALKTITYADVITTPIWRLLLLKWNAVEIYLRKFAKAKLSLNITNGIGGTLDMVNGYYEKDDDESKKLRVPRYVWKTVCQTRDCSTAILIVMHNNPFTKTEPDSCADSCTKYGWIIDNHDYRTGLIYCCMLTAEVAARFGVYFMWIGNSEIYDITDRSLINSVSDVVSIPKEGSYPYDW